jgi:DNA replicative helicase MCM subunit Mcm2 (Cdc46/Mcm family)
VECEACGSPASRAKFDMNLEGSQGQIVQYFELSSGQTGRRILVVASGKMLDFAKPGDCLVVEGLVVQRRPPKVARDKSLEPPSLSIVAESIVLDPS